MGANLGNLVIAQVIGWRVHIEDKVERDLGGIDAQLQLWANQVLKLPTPPKKSGSKVQGGLEGSKSKSSLGDTFVCQNDDFTRG